MNKCKFSADRIYRYSLLHDMREPLLPESLRLIAWIGLNPSTADEQKLDPTLRRVRAFTAGFGGNAFVMLNLFGYRATLPRDMLAQQDPVGLDNDAAILAETDGALMIICAWGNDGGHLERDQQVIKMLRRAGRPLWALRLTGTGAPNHPLYLPADTRPIEMPL
jgi:hypothetical protein